MPSIVIISIMYLKLKFSGVPKKEEYKTRLRKLNWAVLIWSVGRLLRAVTSLWDMNAFSAMVLEMRTFEQADVQVNKKTNFIGMTLQEDQLNLLIPMSLIVVYLFVEIVPIWITSDGNFIDIFLNPNFLMEQKDLIAPLLLQEEASQKKLLDQAA